jgi:hypothetical protein
VIFDNKHSKHQMQRKQRFKHQFYGHLFLVFGIHARMDYLHCSSQRGERDGIGQLNIDAAAAAHVYDDKGAFA